MTTETAIAKVELDGQQADNQLKELQAKARELRNELKEMRMTKDPGYAAKKREFDALDKSIKEARKSTFDLNRIMKDLSGASLKELTSAQRSLNAELRGMNRTTEEGRKAFAEKSKQLQQVQAEIKRTTAQMKGMDSQGGIMNKTVGQLRMGWVALTAALYGAFRGISNLMEAYDKRAKANETLLFALNQEESVQRRLIGLANEMQRRLGIDDDILKDQMIFLAMQGRTETQIRNTMQAAAELSKVMGIGLQQAVQYLDATMEGNIGRLGRLDEGFTKLTLEQLKNGAAVDLINAKYGGLAEKSFQQGLGPLRRFQNAWGDLQKTLGGFLVNALMPVFNGLSRGMDNLNVVFDRFTTTANQRFSDQIQKVADLETGIRPLLARYDELATKSNLSTLEQEELSRIIAEVSKALPSAATRFDEYGRAIEISTDRVREFIDQQRAMMQYENRAAIKEVERDIESVNKKLADISPDIEAIKQTGTFQVFRRYFDQQTKEWTEGWRDASRTQVEETIATNQRLLFERSGMIARLEELNGDALQKEIERRKQEAEANDKIIDKKEEISEATEATRRAYIELTKAISQGREALSDYVAEQDYAGAEQQTAALQVLESQKAIIDEIVRAGGTWDAFMAKLRDQEFVSIMERNKVALDEFLDSLDEDIANDLASAIEAATEANDKQLETFKKIGSEGKKIPQEWKDAGIDAADSIANATLDIYKNNLSAQMDAQLAALNNRREAELANENLTADQRAEIEERYRRQEARIKQEQFRKQKAADIIQSIINTALAVTRALPNVPLAVAAGIAGAAQTAVIAAQKVPQYFSGRYDVIGEDDGKKYNVPHAGLAQTGIYGRTILVAERGPEIVIDAPTTKNIRMNYPEIMDAIMAARVPQFASGRYPQQPVAAQPPFQAANLNNLPETMKHLSISINVLNSQLRNLKEQLSKGLKATMDYQDFSDFNDKVKDVDSLKI